MPRAAPLALLLALAALLAPTAFAATCVHYSSPPSSSRRLLVSRRALHSIETPATQDAPAAQLEAEQGEPAVLSLSMAERLELVDLSEHTELLSATSQDGSAPRLDVEAALAAGYSQRAVAYLAGWYEEQSTAPAPAHGAAAGGVAPRSLPSVAVKAALKAAAKNWPKIVKAVEKVIGRAAAAKYFNLSKFQSALEMALGAQNAIEAAVTTAVAFMLPSSMSWAVAPIAWVLTTFVLPV